MRSSYLGGVLFIALIRRGEPAPPPHDPAEGKRPSMWQEARAGLGYVARSPYLRNIAACTGTLNLFGNIGGVLLLLYVVEELGLSAGTIGLILAIGNIGVLLGALTGGRLAKAFGIGPTIVATAALSGVALVFIPLAPRDDPFWFLVAGGIIGGFTAVAYNVNQVGLRQAITPDRMMGRMNATMRLIVWGTIPIGALIGGFLGGAHRAAGDALGVGHRFVPRVPPGPLLAGADAARDPGAGRMTLETPMRCSALAEELGEPMIGSVDQPGALDPGRGPQRLGQRCRQGRARRGVRARREGARAAAAPHPATRGRSRGRYGAPRHPGRHRERRDGGACHRRSVRAPAERARR